MNEIEARRVLRVELERWRRRSFLELSAEVGESRQFESRGESGASYQIDVQVLWDGEPNGAIRVLASIDDGGWRAFVPLTQDFILAPDGTFVGE